VSISEDYSKLVSQDPHPCEDKKEADDLVYENAVRSFSYIDDIGDGEQNLQDTSWILGRMGLSMRNFLGQWASLGHHKQSQ